MMVYRKCKRMTVHAIGVDSEGNIEYARNGNPAICSGEEGKCGCIHAEIRLLKKMPNPVSVSVSHAPCLNCAKALVKAEVKTVIFLKSYRSGEGVSWLLSHNILLIDLQQMNLTYHPKDPINTVKYDGRFDPR